jgi:hypothetical protein
MLRSEESGVDGGDPVDTARASLWSGRPSRRRGPRATIYPDGWGCELARPVAVLPGRGARREANPRLAGEGGPAPPNGWIYGYDAELAVSRSA